MTSKAKGIPFHVEVNAAEGGVKKQSYIKCEDIRSISKSRLDKRWGKVSPATMAAVADRVRVLLEL